MNENKFIREQAIAHVLAVEEEINRKVAAQYIGMPREELKEIMLTVVRKTEELQIFCFEHELNFYEITGR